MTRPGPLKDPETTGYAASNAINATTRALRRAARLTDTRRPAAGGTDSSALIADRTVGWCACSRQETICVGISGCFFGPDAYGPLDNHPLRALKDSS